MLKNAIQENHKHLFKTPKNNGIDGFILTNVFKYIST